MASPRRRVPDTHRRPARAARVDDSPGWVAGRPGAARPSGRIGAAWTRPPVLVDRELVRPAQPWRPARCQSASVLSGLAAPPRFGRQEDAPFVPAGALPITPRGGARLALQGNNSHRAPSRDCRQDPPRSVTGRRQPGRGDRAPDLWLPPSSAVVTPANRRRASDPSRVRIASDDGTRVMAAIRGGVQHPGRSRGRVTGPRSPPPIRASIQGRRRRRGGRTGPPSQILTGRWPSTVSRTARSSRRGSKPTFKNVLHDLGVGSQPRYEIRPEAGESDPVEHLGWNLPNWLLEFVTGLLDSNLLGPPWAAGRVTKFVGCDGMLL
jgi:hypothetical protein